MLKRPWSKHFLSGWKSSLEIARAFFSSYYFYYFSLLLFSVLSCSAFQSSLAFAEGPVGGAIQGTLFAPGGTPVTSSSVDFQLQLYDKSGVCLLYQENHDDVDLSTTEGDFSLQLGNGTSKTNYADSGSPTALTSFVYRNDVTIGAVPGCPGGVTLAAGDERKVRVRFDIGSGFASLSPDLTVLSTPYANVAQSVGGKTVSDLITVRDDATYDLTQANVENIFSTTNYPILQTLLAGTSSQYIRANPSGSVFFNDQRLTNVASPLLTTDAANRGYVDSVIGGRTTDLSGVSSVTGDGRTLVWDQAGNRWVTGLATAVDATKLPLAGGTMTGNINMNGYRLTNLAANSIATSAIANNAITAAKINNTGTGINRLLITDAVDGSTIGYSICNLNEVLRWTATGWACSSVSTIAPVTSVAGKSGAVTLNMGDISGYGTSALVNTGTGASEIVQLDGLARIPALDGSLITNVNAVRIQNRSVASTAPTDSQVLTWNNTTAVWEPRTFSGGSGMTSLTGDVVGTGPGASSTTIVNNAITSAKINATGVAANQLLITDAAAGSTVTYKSCLNGEILKWNTGTGWGCAADAGSGLFADGSATAPSISFTSDTDTGIYRASANQIEIATGGTARVAVNALGNVGIGTPAPSYMLHAATNNSSSSPTPIMALENTFSGAGTPNRFQVSLGASGNRGTYLENYENGSLVAQLILSQYGIRSNLPLWLPNGSASSPAFTFTNGYTTGLFRSTSNDLGFSTLGTERQRITNLGNLGIGTTSPQAILDVTSTTTMSALIVPRATTANRPQAGYQVNGMIRYNTDNNKFEAYEAGAWVNMIGTSGTSSGLFADGSATAPSISFTNDTDTGIYRAGANQLAIATGGTARVAVDNLGNMGIGITSPNASLHVVSTSTSTVPLIVKSANAVGTGSNIQTWMDSANTSLAGIDRWGGLILLGGQIYLGYSGSGVGFESYGSPLYLTPESNRNLVLNISGGGKVGIGNQNPAAVLDIASTNTLSALIVPRATTANRPQAGFQVNGMIRYNTDNNKFEAYENGGWVNMINTTGTGAITPNAFAFTNQTSVSVSSLITSDTVTLSGFTGSLTASCIGCSAIARNGSWGSTIVTGFNSGDTIALRLFSAPVASQIVTANVTVGSTVSTTWQVSTSGTGPNAFSFTNVTDASPGITYTSNAVTLSGFTGPLTASCSGDCFAMARNGVWGGTTGTGYQSGDTIAIRVNASINSSGVKTASATVGTTTSSTWTVTSLANTCGVPLVVGSICTDGTVYAGLSPDGNGPMYTTVCDSNQYWDGSACVTCASGQWSGSGTTCSTTYTRTWNNGSGTWTDTGFTNQNTGRANTTGLATLVDGGSPYNAAGYCENLTAYGSSDWHLPARNELNVLYTNRVAVANFNTSGSLYWSSSELNNGNAWNQRFSDGIQYFNFKNSPNLVRCVRR